MKVSDLNIEKMVDEIQKENGIISEVYFVACGGSLVDMYSGMYFVNAEAASMSALWITSKLSSAGTAEDNP